ncbi:MAG TPA: nuclear transport factor 2 family protein [Chthonomonadaceae bacterium]|nr:nuclear transport factor 2 family protein [Chthonomonadaceae bacterium]
MSQFTDVIDRYIAIWNETDAERRRTLIAQTWTEDATYLDPLQHGEGQAGIDAMIQKAQTQFSGLRIRRAGEVDTHNDRVRFTWELGPEEGQAVAGGVDFGVLAGGRLQAITGFLDFAPQPACLES